MNFKLESILCTAILVQQLSATWIFKSIFIGLQLTIWQEFNPLDYISFSQ